jgi:hypothetical protein
VWIGKTLVRPVGAHALEPADKHAQTGRVEELHALHVDDEVVLAAAHEVDELLAELGRRVDVDLAPHDDHGAVTCRAVLGAGRQGQVHGLLLGRAGGVRVWRAVSGVRQQPRIRGSDAPYPGRSSI